MKFISLTFLLIFSIGCSSTSKIKTLETSGKLMKGKTEHFGRTDIIG